MTGDESEGYAPVQSGRAPAWATALSLGALLLFVGLAHHGVPSATMTWDDYHLLGDAGPVVQAAHWTDLFVGRFWDLADGANTQSSFYRPVTLASYWLGAHAHGGFARGFHVTNLLLHGLVCALVFGLALRRGASLPAAALGAALFGVFPRLTESVAFVAGRTDLLAAVGAVAAVLLHRGGPGGTSFRVAAAVSLLFGLLAKEVAAAAAVAIVIGAWMRRRAATAAERPGLAVELAPLSVALAVYALARIGAGVQMDPVSFPPWPARALLPLQALGEYAVMLATPWRSQLVIGSVGWVEPLRVVLGVGVLAVLSWLGLLAWRGRMSWERGELLALSLAALAPVLHVVALPTRAVAADRFLYLPLAAVGVIVSLAVPAAAPARRRALAVLAGVAALLAVGTHLREQDWQDEIRLWTVEAERAHPASGVAHFELANVVARTGDVDGALAGYQESLRRERVLQAREPEYALPVTLLANTALMLSARGDEAAIPMLEEAVKIAPESAIYQIYLASALARSFDFEEADARFAEAERLFPDYELAKVLRSQSLEAGRLWKALPPQDLQEPIPIRAARAFVYHLIGRLEESADLWLQVARSDEATRQELQSAREALEQQRQTIGDTPQLQALAKALDAR